MRTANTSKFLIYALIDPRDRELRYIGRSSNWLFRAESHWKHKPEYGKQTHFCNWVRNVIESGHVPEIAVLQEFDENTENINEALDEAEIYWIATFRSLGARLTNMLAGGRTAKKTPELLQQMSEAMKGERNPFFGKTHPPEVLAQMLATRTANKHLHKTTKGRRHSNEAKQLMKLGTKRKEVICITDGQSFVCIYDAARYYGIARATVRDCCLGRREQTSAGLRFIFKT